MASLTRSFAIFFTCLVLAEDVALGLEPGSAVAKELTCTSKLMAAPIKTGDPRLSEDLADMVRKEIARYANKPCLANRFLNEKKSLENFDYAGFNAYFGGPIERLTSTQIERLVEGLNVTHLVQAFWSNDAEQLAIKVYSIEKNRVITKVITFQSHLTPAMAKNVRRSSWLLRTLSLLTPNTATLGFASTDIGDSRSSGFQDGKNGYVAKETHKRSKWPPIISSVGMSKIEHPNAYRLFDFDYSIFPSNYLFGIDQETTFSRKTLTNPDGPEEERSATIEAYGACGNVNIMGLVHSPIGTTYVGVGLGPCLYRKRSDEGDPIWRLDFASRYLLGHRVFFSQRYYIFYAIDQLNFIHPVYDTDVARYTQISRGVLGIGYYLPDVERRFANFAAPNVN